MTTRLTGLGRGLGALIPSQGPDVRFVDVDLVTPNPYQPRSIMLPEDLNDLAESIREHGVLQPLLVTEVRTENGGTIYQLIAGERRLQAARMVELAKVPVIVREATPRDQLELALIENIQRSDLNPMEEAAAYQRLAEEFNLTQADVARRVGKSRAAVTNAMRLLDLDEEIKASLAHGKITAGHARALLGIHDDAARKAAWRRAIDGQLTVRQIESAGRKASRRKSHTPLTSVLTDEDPEEKRLLNTLRKALGTKVEIRRNGGAGTVNIHFYSDEELDTIIDYLLGA